LLQGGAEVGRRLATTGGIRAVAFTGSLAGGRALFDSAGSRPDPIPVYAEMGSLNPVVVTAAAAAARGEAIAAALVGAVTGSSGQLCTKPGVVLGPPAALDTLAEALVAPVADATGPLLTSAMRDGLDAQLAGTAAQPGVVLVGADPGPAGEGLGFRGAVLRCDLATFATTRALREEHFGPVCVLVDCPEDDLPGAVALLEGSLTGTLHAEPQDDALAGAVLDALARRCGRVVVGGVPTGVRVGRATHHGGPWPATTTPLTTSVGSAAVDRFLRPVAFQDVPDRLLPAPLADANPWGIVRRVDGILTRDPVRR
jgi:NADP-dependent aldehyde dehydrogenase